MEKRVLEGDQLRQFLWRARIEKARGGGGKGMKGELSPLHYGRAGGVVTHGDTHRSAKTE